MPRRSTQREPIRTPGRNFEENRALHGPVHVAKILGTPPDEPKPESDEPVKSKTALHDEVPRPFRPPSPASCTGGSAPVGATQAEGLRSLQGVAEEVAGGDAAPVAPLDASAGPRGTELAEFTPDEQGVGAPPDPEASPARSAMSQMSRIPPAAPRSSAKPAHTPRRQSPGSKLPTPRRKDAHYKEDKVRGSSFGERYGRSVPRSAWHRPICDSFDQPVVGWGRAGSTLARHTPALCFSHRTRPARASGVSATGDAPVRMLDRARLRARPLAWVLRPGGAPQAAQSARRRLHSRPQ